MRTGRVEPSAGAARTVPWPIARARATIDEHVATQRAGGQAAQREHVSVRRRRIGRDRAEARVRPQREAHALLRPHDDVRAVLGGALEHRTEHERPAARRRDDSEQGGGRARPTAAHCRTCSA